MKLHKLLIVVLLITCFCSCKNDQAVHAYMVAKPTPKQINVHNWRPVMRVTFRVSESKVISEVAGLLDEYEDCNVLDRNNWECHYTDGTGSNRFGFIDGKYWKNPGWDNNIKYVSRWEYNLIRCKWFQYNKGKLRGTVLCLKTFI